MKNLLIALATVLALAPLASAQLWWGDNFDNNGGTGSPAITPYSVGTFPAAGAGDRSDLHGGWDTWYQTSGAEGQILPTPAGTLSATPAGTNSLYVQTVTTNAAGCDMVQWHESESTPVGNTFNSGEYDQTLLQGAPTSGTWQYKLKYFMPSSELTAGGGSHYFIVNDTYTANPGSATWICQTQFNNVAGTVNSDQRAAAVAAQIIPDEWVEFTCTIDLDNDCIALTYGGLVVGNGPIFVPGWNTNVTPRISNIDCFTVATGQYLDDMTLTQLAPGPQYQVDTYDAVNLFGISADINSATGSSCGVAQAIVTGGSTVNVNVNTNFPTVVEAIVNVGNASAYGLPLGPYQLNVPIPGLPGSSSFFLYNVLAGGNGTTPSPTGYAGGPSTVLSFNAPNAPGLNFAIQYANLADGLSPSGFTLSKPTELRIQ